VTPCCSGCASKEWRRRRSRTHSRICISSACTTWAKPSRAGSRPRATTVRAQLDALGGLLGVSTFTLVLERAVGKLTRHGAVGAGVKGEPVVEPLRAADGGDATVMYAKPAIKSVTIQGAPAQGETLSAVALYSSGAEHFFRYQWCVVPLCRPVPTPKPVRFATSESLYYCLSHAPTLPRETEAALPPPPPPLRAGFVCRARPAVRSTPPWPARRSRS
jgi:hypothetical protein